MKLVPKLAEGLTILPYAELVERSAAHMQRRGEWRPGILRPSLLAMECRLARVKTFLGHAPQPGATFDHARRGLPDPASNLVMARGAWLEGVVVAALEAAGVPVVLRSPTPVTATELGGSWNFANALGGAEWYYECHPDLIVGPQARPVQIKCPSDRALAYFLDGREDTILSRYGTQILAELYILELAGWEPDGATLLLVSAEPWPPSSRDSGTPIRAFEVEFTWGYQQRQAVLARIRETMEDIECARAGLWPEALPLDRAASFPCSYCPFPRIPMTVAQAGCDEHARWTNSSLPALRVV